MNNFKKIYKIINKNLIKMKKKLNKRGNSYYHSKKVIFPPIESNKMKISSKNLYQAIKKRCINHTPDYNKKILLDISSYKSIIKKKDNEINLIQNKKRILEGRQKFNEDIANKIFLKDIDVENTIMKNNTKILLGSNINTNNEKIANNYKTNVNKLEDKKKEYLDGKKEIADLKNELAEYDNSILNIESKISQKKKEINNQKNKINIAQNNKNQRKEILEKEEQKQFNEKNNIKSLNEEIKRNENISNENNLKIKNNEKEIEALKKELEDLKKNI